MSMIAELVRNNKGWILLTALASAAAGIMNMWLVKLANQYAIGIDDMSAAVLRYSLTLCLMFLVGMAFQHIMASLSGRIFYQARRELTRRVSALTYERMEGIGRHRIFSALTHDLSDVNQMVMLLPNYVFNGTVALACLIYLSSISPKLFAVVVLYMTLGLSISRRYIFTRGEVKFRELRKIQDQLFLCYQGIVDGHKELTLHADRRARFHEDQLDAASRDYRNKSLQANFFWSLAHNWNTAIVFASIGTVVFSASALLDIGAMSLVPFLVVILYLTGPVSQLLNGLRTISRAQVALARLRELGIFSAGDTKPAAAAATGETLPLEPFERLSLRDVHYEYGDSTTGDRFSVGPVDIDIERGELVYIVGGNGSGKTTVAKLIAGLYERSSGRLLLNGRDVPAQVPAQYHWYFSTVLADYHLFETLLSKNAQDFDAAAAHAMLEELQLSQKTGLDGNAIRNTDLSQGQKKRLALLTACFDDSEIYVFDEWAAEQDPEFRDYFYRHFLPQMKQRGKTAIVVTHDDRYFQLADKLIKFERGQIVSQTTGALETDRHRRPAAGAAPRETRDAVASQ